MTTTPNMNLPVPVPATTDGPTWATQLVADMDIIDAHDHTPGKGVPITPDGIDINADLSLADNSLTGVKAVEFSSQGAALSDLDSLYVVDEDLYYTDGSGNQVRITQGGSVTGSSGTITGLPSGTASASYSGGTFSFQSATSTPATLSVGPVKFGRQVSGTKTVTLSTDAAQAANYDVAMPAALPATTYPMAISSAGNITASGTIQLAAGSAATPSLYMNSDTNSGIYQSAADEVAVATGGTLRLKVASTAITPTVKILAQDGINTAPAYSFDNDQNTGIYSAGSDNMVLTAGGSGSATVTPTTIDVGSGNGSAAAPTLSFNGDSNTGLYRVGTDSVGLTCGGSQIQRWETTGATVTGNLDVSSNLSAGVTALTSVNLNGGGAFKVTIYTGSLGSTATATLNPGAAIYSVMGWSQFNSGSTYLPMTGTSSAGTSGQVDIQAGSTTDVTIQNYDTNSTNAYRVVIIHA